MGIWVSERLIKAFLKFGFSDPLCSRARDRSCSLLRCNYISERLRYSACAVNMFSWVSSAKRFKCRPRRRHIIHQSAQSERNIPKRTSYILTPAACWAYVRVRTGGMTNGTYACFVTPSWGFRGTGNSSRGPCCGRVVLPSACRTPACITNEGLRKEKSSWEISADVRELCRQERQFQPADHVMALGFRDYVI